MRPTTRSFTLVVAILLSMFLATFSALALTSEEKEILLDIRSNIFGGSRLAAAFDQTSISGVEPTIFPLEVEDRGLLVWEIPEGNAASFAQQIGLEAPFTLSKVRPLTVRGPQALDAQFRAWLQSLGLQRWIEALYPERYYVIADT